MDHFRANEQHQTDLCIQLKSWCDQWVSISELDDRSSFDTGHSDLDTAETNQSEALRCGSKECQSSPILTRALIACEPEEEKSCFLAIRPRQDEKYDLQICGGGEGQGLGQGLFLGFVGRRVGVKQRSGLDTAFAVRFGDNDRVCFQGGSENLFLSADPQGRIYTGPTRPRKWEWFTMLPQSQPGPCASSPMPLPVRVSLRGHNGRYLCTSHATVSAHAEVPCCCEELLLQVGPIPLRNSADSEMDDPSPNVWSTISAGTEDEVLSADQSGSLSVIPRESARGREIFLVHLTCPKWPRVAILHQTLQRDSSPELSKHGRNEGPSDRGTCPGERGKNHEGVKADQGKSPGESLKFYVGVESNGRVVCERPLPHTWEQFTLELVSGSRVFIQGVNGRFLTGAPKRDGSDRTPVNATVSQPSDCWEVRSHGDGLYTLVLAPVETGRGETYLFVDDFGRLQQSNEPAVQFPGTCSLFFLEPVAARALRSGGRQERGARNPAKDLLAHLARRGTEEGLGFRVSDERIVGFSIRTAGKVSGRERYLSVEPNGAVRASRTRVGRTEIFALSDINALAARADPLAFPCRAAAHSILNPLQTPPVPPPATAQQRADVRAAEEAAAREARAELYRQRQQCRAAARALETGVPNPKPRPATLQALCSDAIATEAARRLPCPPRCSSPAACLSSWGVGLPHLSPPQNVPKQPLGNGKPEALLDGMLGVLAGAAAPPCCYDGAFPEETRTETMRVIPNDVLDQIDATWAARQPRAHSCKGHLAPYRRFSERARARAFHAMHRAPHRGFSDEGFVCKQCYRDGLTRLDPVVNPAHHRFLEVQQRLRGVNGPSPRAVWNPLTVTAVSMVSTLLYFSRGPSGGRRPRGDANVDSE